MCDLNKVFRLLEKEDDFRVKEEDVLSTQTICLRDKPKFM
jgi:hypothetical protein